MRDCDFGLHHAPHKFCLKIYQNWAHLGQIKPRAGAEGWEGLGRFGKVARGQVAAGEGMGWPGLFGARLGGGSAHVGRRLAHDTLSLLLVCGPTEDKSRGPRAASPRTRVSRRGVPQLGICVSGRATRWRFGTELRCKRGLRKGTRLAIVDNYFNRFINSTAHKLLAHFWTSSTVSFHPAHPAAAKNTHLKRPPERYTH